MVVESTLDLLSNFCRRDVGIEDNTNDFALSLGPLKLECALADQRESLEQIGLLVLTLSVVVEKMRVRAWCLLLLNFFTTLLSLH